MAFQNSNSSATRVFNVVTASINQKSFYIKNEPGRLHNIVINYSSGSIGGVDRWNVYDETSASLAAGSGSLIGGNRYNLNSVTTELNYNLVFNNGLTIQTNPSGTLDISVIYE